MRFYDGNVPDAAVVTERFIGPSPFNAADTEAWELYIFPYKCRGEWLSFKLIARPRAVWMKANYWIAWSLKKGALRMWGDEKLLAEHRPELAEAVIYDIKLLVARFDLEAGEQVAEIYEEISPLDVPTEYGVRTRMGVTTGSNGSETATGSDSGPEEGDSSSLGVRTRIARSGPRILERGPTTTGLTTLTDENSFGDDEDLL